MTDVTKLFEAFAAVAWPAIVILLIFLFRPAAAALIESAKSRKFTLKIGGQELTMEEASEQQRTLIADLQTQVLEIKRYLEGVGGGDEALGIGTSGAGALRPHREKEAAQVAKTPAARSILWVDDQPKNNSYFFQQLADQEISVDLALSTSSGLQLFDKKNYGVVISDMSRIEDGTYNGKAGLELLRKIRERNKTIPFIIFCSPGGVRQHRDEAVGLGATAITSSQTEMFGLLQAAVGDIRA